MDPEVYILISKNMATLKELTIDYSTEDMYDMLEVLDLSNDLEWASHKDHETESKRGS